MPSSCLRRSLKAAGCTAAIAVGLGLLAGKVEAQAGVIYACVNANNGNTRIVGATEGCRNPEIRVQWNANGLQGPQGPVGSQGATGPQGAAGPQGPQGQIGPQGPAGQDGANGTDGTNGTDGADGAAGLTWRGTWNAGTAYVEHDAVAKDGSSYVALIANMNDAPPSASWNLLAEKGAQGTPGINGTNGAPGANGTDGTNGTNGLPGTTGQDAKMAQSTNQVQLSSPNVFSQVPGMTLDVVVPSATSALVVSTDGGFFATNTITPAVPPVATDGVTVEVVITVLSGGQNVIKARRRITLTVGSTTLGNVANWSFSTVLTGLTGTQTVKVFAQLVGGSPNVGAVVGSGTAGSAFQSTMIAEVINK